ncbi:hypothetical protein V1280_004992 [Bradyrhizobium sp. AZCC 2230]
MAELWNWVSKCVPSTEKYVGSLISPVGVVPMAGGRVPEQIQWSPGRVLVAQAAHAPETTFGDLVLDGTDGIVGTRIGGSIVWIEIPADPAAQDQLDIGTTAAGTGQSQHPRHASGDQPGVTAARIGGWKGVHGRDVVRRRRMRYESASQRRIADVVDVAESVLGEKAGAQVCVAEADADRDVVAELTLKLMLGGEDRRAIRIADAG